MDSDGGIRASDADRESAVEVLRAAYAEGRLTLDEFDDRTTAAYAARTWAALRELTSDLPVGVSLARPAPGVRPMPAHGQLPAAGRPGFFPVLPLVLLFIILAGSPHAALALAPALVILLVWLRLTGRRWHNGGRPGSGRA